MSEKNITAIAQAIINISIFLELSDKNTIDEDRAIEALEQISADISEFEYDFKLQLSKSILKLVIKYPKNLHCYINNLPENLGIVD